MVGIIVHANASPGAQLISRPVVRGGTALRPEMLDSNPARYKIIKLRGGIAAFSYNTLSGFFERSLRAGYSAS